MTDRLKDLEKLMDESVFRDVTFSNKNKRRVLAKVKRKKRKPFMTPGLATVAFVLIAIGFIGILVTEEGAPNTELATGEETIVDSDTSPEVPSVTPDEDMLLVDGLADSMDRGNGEYMTGPLVVDPTDTEFDRGDVVYYETPSEVFEKQPNWSEFDAARIVGLPGETVEIINGQVYINGKKLDTFYAEPLVGGMEKEEFFRHAEENPGSIQIEEEARREYFSQDMKTVEVQEGTFFVLVDQWWRGFDSRFFGLLPKERVQGTVLGYANGREMPADEIMDNDTIQKVPTVGKTDDLFEIEWQSDAMDSGNHDYDTAQHGNLLVDPSFSNVGRGDVIYYKTPQSALEKNPQLSDLYIARVVGLPGETVAIKDGSVYINGTARLETFYGQATVRGMEEDAFMEYAKANPDKVNVEGFRKYFSMDMAPVEVPEGTVFVLVDQWWRGTDSRNFGPLPLEQVKGKVIGYKK